MTSQWRHNPIFLNNEWMHEFSCIVCLPAIDIFPDSFLLLLHNIFPSWSFEIFAPEKFPIKIFNLEMAVT